MVTFYPLQQCLPCFPDKYIIAQTKPFMNRNSALAHRIFILSAVLLCASCLEEFNDIDKLKKTTFSPQLEFPLVNSDFTMEEFLTEGESNASITEQGSVMVLTYDDTLRTPGGENFFLLPDQH